jgi:hypothetical protein
VKSAVTVSAVAIITAPDTALITGESAGFFIFLKKKLDINRHILLIIIASEAVDAPNSLKVYVIIRTAMYRGIRFFVSTIVHRNAAMHEKTAPACAPIPEHTAALKTNGMTDVKV